jgi:hypothetical protein
LATAVKKRPAAPKSGPDQDLYPFWVGEWPRLTGRQAPAWESKFVDGVDFYHGDRLGRFAHKIGERQMPWQWSTMRNILAVRPDGLWAHPDVCLIIPRQNGKTELAVMRILYGLFYLGEKIVYTAQRWQTAEDVFDRVVEIIKRRPHLRKRLAKQPTKGGNHGVVELTNGAELQMGPRGASVGRGMTKIDLAIFDEAYDLKDTAVGSLTGAQNAATNPQTWYISTPVVQEVHPNCSVLAGMRRNGLRGEPDLFCAEWAAPAGMARSDPAGWRLAHPSHGVILKDRDLGRHLRNARSTTALKIFDADYLGWGDWPPDDADRESVIPKEVWADLTQRDPALVGDVCIVVERTLDKRWWAIAAGQRTVDGRVHLEVGYWRKANIGQVGAALLELVELWDPPAVVVDDKSPAKPLAPFMKNQGIEMVVSNTPQLAVATQGFIDGVMSGDITHTGQKILETAVDNAQTRLLPRGDMVWDESESGDEMATLKAITLAHWAVLTFAQERRKTASPSSGADAADIHDLDAPAEASVLDVAF